ncbi:aminotransferase-like domain-containing protein [Streptomyces sp. NPDC004262]
MGTVAAKEAASTAGPSSAGGLTLRVTARRQFDADRERRGFGDLATTAVREAVDRDDHGLREFLDAPGQCLAASDDLAQRSFGTAGDTGRERRIALATATRVYAELGALGLVVGEPGRGPFVRVRSGFDGLEPPRDLPVPRVADLSFNQPLAPGQGDQLRQALRAPATAGDVEALLRGQPPGGHRHDRAVAAARLLGRGIDAVPHYVLLTSGTQQALDVVLHAVTRPGDVVAVDAVTCPGIKLLVSAHGLDLVPVPAAASGPDLDVLDRLCRARPVRALCTIPAVHNPLGRVLDRDRRERLAAVARSHDCVIVEDGTHAFLESSPPPPLQALAPERTCHVADRREEAAARQGIARAALAGLDVTAHPVSYVVWLGLEPHQCPDQVADALAERGVLVSTRDAFAVGPHRPRALRLAPAGPRRDDLGPVLRTVRDVLDAILP